MPAWSDVVQIAVQLPGVEEATWYRTAGLKVAGKGFARLRAEADGALVLMCELPEKAALLQSGDPAFYTRPHYDGYGAILVNLDRGGSGAAGRVDHRIMAGQGAGEDRKRFDADQR
jgi:hypothetical protein